METKHTPGPWAYKWNGSYYEVDIAHTDDRILSVAVMLYDENVVSLTDTDENKANAILIAAAPEMLDMLKDISDTLEAGDTPHVYQINELIKKATEQ